MTAHFLPTLVLALVLVAVPVRARDDKRSRATLKGLEGVLVVVEGFSADNGRAGFSEEPFKTAAELKLRLAGIKVSTKEERAASPGKPYLYVHVNTLATEPNRGEPFSINLQMHQTVHLVRNVEFATATTWSKGITGNGDADFVLETFKGLMNRFLNAWLSVNPRENAR